MEIEGGRGGELRVDGVATTGCGAGCEGLAWDLLRSSSGLGCEERLGAREEGFGELRGGLGVMVAGGVGARMAT